MGITDYPTEALEAEILRRRQNAIITRIVFDFPKCTVRSFAIEDGDTLEVKSFNDEGEQILDIDDWVGPFTMLIIRDLQT